jgi:hypothetical protein
MIVTANLELQENFLPGAKLKTIDSYEPKPNF